MSLTFTTADAVLKEDYKDPLRNQLNESCFMLSQLEKNTEDVVGLRAYLALRTGRSSGVGARGELGTLPTAAAQGYTEAWTPIRYNYGRIQISGPIIRAMGSDRGSFIRAVKSETDGIKKDLKRDVNRQVWGTSDGVIATLKTKASNVVLDLDAATSRTQIRQAFAQGGMVVDIGTTSDYDSVASGLTVSDFDFTNQTITVSSATATTAGDVISRTGSGGHSSGSGLPGDGQFELTGLQDIVDDTSTLFGVNPSTTQVWASYIDENSGSNRSLTEPMVNKAIQYSEIESEEQVDLLCGSDGVSRFAASLLESIRRNVDNVELKAGYSGIRWDTTSEGMRDSKRRALVWDQDAPANTLFGLCTDRLVEFVMSDWEWMDEDGAVLSRVSGVDAYEATLFKYHEQAADQRNCHFRIDDLTEA